MKSFYKVVCKPYGIKKTFYFEAMTLCGLIEFWGIAGGPIGPVVEIKEVSRVPKGVKVEKAYFD